MSKKISSGILLLIFSAVAVDLQASLMDSLNEKVAAAKEKIKKIELKDVLKYTAAAAAVTAVGVLAIVAHKNTQQGIGEIKGSLNNLNEKTENTQSTIQEVTQGLVEYVSRITGSLDRLATNRAKLLAAIKRTDGTYDQSQIVEVERQVEQGIQEEEQARTSLMNKLRGIRIGKKKSNETKATES